MATDPLHLRGDSVVHARTLGRHVNRSMVVAISVDEEEILERVECSSADEAGRAVANLLLRGYEYLHIDNLSALDRRQNTT